MDGFKHGFSLQYQGTLKDCKRTAPNLKLRVGNKLELWNKVMNEVELGRYAGPFEEPPFEAFVQSPIGLVPKDKGLKKRLIFHLSYPREGDSVNSGFRMKNVQLSIQNSMRQSRYVWRSVGTVKLENLTCPVHLDMSQWLRTNGGYW